jgi:hypothetical protein
VFFKQIHHAVVLPPKHPPTSTFKTAMTFSRVKSRKQRPWTTKPKTSSHRHCSQNWKVKYVLVGVREGLNIELWNMTRNTLCNIESCDTILMLEEHELSGVEVWMQQGRENSPEQGD